MPPVKMKLADLSSLRGRSSQVVGIKQEKVALSQQNSLFQFFTWIRNSLFKFVSHTGRIQAENRDAASVMMQLLTAVYGNDVSLSRDQKTHCLLMEGKRVLTLGRVHKVTAQYTSLKEVRSAEISRHLTPQLHNKSDVVRKEIEKHIFSKMKTLFGINTPVNERHIAFLLYCREHDIGDEDTRQLSDWVSEKNEHIPLDTWMARYQAERAENTAAWKKFMEEIVAKYGNSNLLENVLDDVPGGMPKNNKTRFLLTEGRLKLTRNKEEEIKQRCADQLEIWIEQKMQAVFAGTEKTARHIEFLRYCKKQNIDSDTHVRLLSAWVSSENQDIARWIITESTAALNDSFSTLTEALTPGKSRAAMLNALYYFCNTSDLMALSDKKEFGIDAREQWQKNYVLQQLRPGDRQQAETLLQNLMSHPWTREILTFMVHKPKIVTNNLADVIKDDEQASGKISYAWNQPAILVAIMDACVKHLDADRQQEVNNWMEQCIDTDYGHHFGLIDSDFYADLCTVWKTQIGLDLEKSMPVQTIINKTFDITEPGPAFDGTIGQSYVEYRHFLKQAAGSR